MTTPKTLRAPTTFDGVPVVERPQQIEKTRELPALDSDDPESELDGADTQAVPRDVIDDDVTVPVHHSIESTLTFEVLRLQSIEADDDEEAP